MIFDYINWNVDPAIFTIFGREIRWYGLLFAITFIVGYYIIQKYFKREGVDSKYLDSLAVYVFLGTLLGARIGHCFFYEPSYYLANPIKIIKVWEGGLASHGGAIGITFALYLFSRKFEKSFFWVIDKVVIVVALGGVFIRTGNLMNSEIYGHVTNLPWGFIFERRGEIEPKHPTQIYESLAYLLIFILLYFLNEKKGNKLKQGTLFALFLITVFTARFFIEFVKEDQVGFEAGMSLNMGQWLSVPCVLIGGFILFFINKKKKTSKA